MNKHIEVGFKKVKLFWDAYKMIIGVVALLGSLGVGGYAAYDVDVEPEAKPEPVALDKVDELKIIHVTPEYALKGHTHPQIIIDHAPGIKQAIEEYEKKHDPQQLGH